MDNQKSASNSSSKNSDNVAAREAAPAKESFTAKLHRWFDIRQMNMAGRYVFLGIVIIFTVLLFFFIGLGIDFVLQQPATMALWLVDRGTQGGKSKTKTRAKPKHRSGKDRQSTANELAKLSPEEQRILAEASMTNTMRDK